MLYILKKVYIEVSVNISCCTQIKIILKAMVPKKF